jgi:ParB family chromosome partitioning protein
MNGPRLADTLKENRLESITRRPSAPGSSASGSMASRTAGLANLAGASMIPIDRIIPDADQPRREFDADALQQLADSLKARGQLQPIRVRWSDTAGHYIVVVGERRWRAAGLAGMKSIACVISQGEASPEDLLQDQLVENALRADLKPIEQARAYRTLMDARGWSLRQLADELHIHFTGIQKALDLLDLPESVQQSVDDGQLAASTAQAIAASIDDPEAQREVAMRVVSEGLNRDQAKELVRVARARKPAARSKGRGGKPKLPTIRTIKTERGKVTVENRKGLDPTTTLEALREAVAKLEAEVGKEVAA